MFQDVLSRPAEEFGNDETLEHLWAAKAMEHSDIYFNVSFLLFINFSENYSYSHLLKLNNTCNVATYIGSREEIQHYQ